MKMAGPIYQYGLDVSQYQGEVDWPQVAASGREFAIIRALASTGSSIDIDPYFLKNVEGAHAAGLKVGAYYYTNAVNEAQAAQEVDALLPLLAGKKFEYPIFIDVEEDSIAQLGPERATTVVLYALRRLKSRRYFSGFYTYTYFAETYLDMQRLAAYPFFVADYAETVGYKGEYDMWQYSDEGNVPGVPDNVDLDVSYRNFLPEIKAGGYNNYGADGPVMRPLSNTRLEVFGPMNCQYFYTPDVYDVVGTLAHGYYAALSLSTAPYGGFTWVRIAVQGEVYWTALLADRCRLVPIGDECASLREENQALQTQLAEKERQLTGVKQSLLTLAEEL